MSRKDAKARLFRESLAPYGAAAGTGVTKLSISLPTDLADLVKAAAADGGSTVSGVIASAIRASMAAAEQARLDRALELDAQENLDWANAYMPIAAKLWAEIEW